MRFERFVTAIDFPALCWASICVTPLYAWKVFDILIPLWEPSLFARLDGHRVSLLISYAFRYPLDTLGLIGVSLFVGPLFQRKAESSPFSLTANSLLFTAVIIVLGLPLAAASIANDNNGKFAQLALVVTVLFDTSVLVAVGVASRLYVAWRVSADAQRDVRRSAAIFGVALALAIIRTIAAFADWQPHSVYAFGSLPGEIELWTITAALRLVVAFGSVGLFGGAAIGLLRRAGGDGRLGMTVLASIGAALVSWVVWYGPDLLLSRISLADSELLDPIPVAAIALRAAFGAAAGLFYFAVVYREAAGQLLHSLPTLIGKARRWRPRDADE